ncbi:hypothetical protein RCH12_002964 [Cryobacterium sp. MP_3.1]|uniref:hypothetical protein n=1 Tax=Cryobacterium sp. MP_3.1 TaxID=3071711 RepID=UPI002DFC7720|nr:hypothetical protein [Cryobacterium sp. MP_3.1]
MIHNLAVRKDARGAVRGRARIERAVSKSREEEVNLLFGIASGPEYLDAVYRSLGFVVHRWGTLLALNLGPRTIYLPLEAAGLRGFTMAINA